MGRILSENYSKIFIMDLNKDAAAAAVLNSLAILSEKETRKIFKEQSFLYIRRMP